MLHKQVWRSLLSLDSLMSRVLKSKYYLETTILDVALGDSSSYTWRSLYEGV